MVPCLADQSLGGDAFAALELVEQVCVGVEGHGRRVAGLAAGLELDSRPARGRRRTPEEIALAGDDVVELTTTAGELKLVPAPAGVPNGFADLRRAATREHLGNRLRPLVASTADLARMTAALRREQDIGRLRELRRIMELEVEREPAAPLEVRSPSEVTRGPREWARLRERDHERGMER